jgi:3-oxoacyl-[acyl-carrier protein] reductase
MIDMNGKSAAFIGAVSELSIGIAGTLADSGASVLFLHPSEAAERLSGDLRVTAMNAALRPLDFTSPETLAESLETVGAPDIVVLCPGHFQPAEFLDTRPVDWDAAIAANYERTTFAAQAIARCMINDSKGGSMIFLSSVMALMPFMQASLIGTTLTAQWALARIAAVDLAPHRIRVNVVAAGWVEDDWTQPYLHDAGRMQITGGIPLARVGTPRDIGHLVAFLASDLASYITGAVIPVDGGYMITRSDGDSPFPDMQGKT